MYSSNYFTSYRKAGYFPMSLDLENTIATYQEALWAGIPLPTPVSVKPFRGDIEAFDEALLDVQTRGVPFLLLCYPYLLESVISLTDEAEDDRGERDAWLELTRVTLASYFSTGLAVDFPEALTAFEEFQAVVHAGMNADDEEVAEYASALTPEEGAAREFLRGRASSPEAMAAFIQLSADESSAYQEGVRKVLLTLMAN